MDRTEKEFTNEQLYNFLVDFKHEVSDQFTEIIAKQDKTNGRLGKLELWRSFLFGVWAVLGILLSVGVPFMFNIISKNSTDIQQLVDQKVSYLIDQKIQANNDKYFEVNK